VSEPGRSHGEGTRVVKAGLPEPEQGQPFLPGPVFAAPFHLQGDPEQAPYSYTRYGNPTWTRFESALGGLEDAEAVLFASGMAAAAALLMTQTGPGDAIAMDDSCYLGVRRLAQTYLETRGVDVRPTPPAAPSWSGWRRPRTRSSRSTTSPSWPVWRARRER
jgi:cystathionine gamma-lyase